MSIKHQNISERYDNQQRMIMEELDQWRFNSKIYKEGMNRHQRNAIKHAGTIAKMRREINELREILQKGKDAMNEVSTLEEMKDRFVESKVDYTYTKSKEGDSMPDVPKDPTKQIYPPLYSKNPGILFPSFHHLIRTEYYNTTNPDSIISVCRSTR